MIHSTQIHSSNQKLLEYLAGWQRARAELDNYKKRQYETEQIARRQLIQEIAQSLLSLVDNFHVMTEHVPPALKDDDWTKGVLHIARQMDQILAEYGITRIETAGLKFDPSIHEAIGYVSKKTVTHGMVAEIVLPGYMIGDQVLRPAKVKVAQ